MINVKTNEQLDQEERARLAAENSPAAQKQRAAIAPRLNAYLESKWEKAKRAKISTYDQMLKNLRQRRGKYEADKIIAIRQMEGSEAFIMLSDTKCRAGESWIRDIMDQPGERPWNIEPTPVPDLPDEVEIQISADFTQKLIDSLVQSYVTQGQPVDLANIKNIVNEKSPQLKQAMAQAMREKAKSNAEQIKDILDDQLQEGGWYKSFSNILKDICDKKSVFLKGPVLRYEKVRKVKEDPATKKPIITYETKAIPTWERRSQWSIYPSPESTTINNGYLFDVVTLTRRDLAGLIGVNGFLESEIRAVLKEHKDGGLANWLLIDNETEYFDALDIDTQFVNDRENIQSLEFWGTAIGSDLIEYGMSKDVITDPDIDYDICCWKIGNHIIKAMLNPDKMGKKPFYKTSYEDDQDTFWGKCVQELIYDIQAFCNAIVRAIINNVGVASGPQIEINVDRMEPGASKKLWPLRVWMVHEADMMSTSPALKVYNVTLNADKLIMLYDKFSKIADEESGIPAYSHGDPQVGGAGNTSSGLAMLLSASARGIKQVIKAIDDNIIAPSVEAQYFWNLDNGKFDNLMCDMNIVATGTSSLIARGQQAVRLKELLDSTNNPIDLQIIGQEGRRDLIAKTAKANEITIKGLDEHSPEETIHDIVAELFKIPTMGQPGSQVGPQPGPGGPPQPAPQTLDNAGNPAQGEGNRLISHEQASAQRVG